MPHLDELIPLGPFQVWAARRLPNRPHVSALWRWCRLGIRGRGGDRVRLEHTRIGMRLYDCLRPRSASLADFGRRLEEADREHFDARHVDHTAGTRIRREFGLEAAAATLGHSSAKLTDEVYAERDLQRVAEVMKRMG